MSFENKYRVHEVAKDFGKQTKDITQILTTYATAPKNHMQVLSDKGLKPMYDTKFIFSVHEEVGHGGATIPRDLDELLIVDMGCVGLDLTCTEYQVSICAKDSAGPFDYDMVTRLSALAREHGIPAVLDVYPHYSSDVAVAWKAGLDAPAALIGPGVQASHGMERTHLEAMLGTLELTARYLDCRGE